MSYFNKRNKKGQFYNPRSEVRLVKPYIAVDIERVEDLNNQSYQPNGGTPLYDAIESAVASIDDVIMRENLKVSRVLTVVHTDGQENASKVHDAASIRRLKEKKEDTGFWTFVYIGSSATTWADSNRIGFARQNTIAYTPQDTKGVFMSAACATSNLRSSNLASTQTFFGGGSMYDNGKEIKADKRHTHLSSDGYTRYEAVKWENGKWSCNCPGWAIHKTCKHIGGGVSAVSK